MNQEIQKKILDEIKQALDIIENLKELIENATSYDVNEINSIKNEISSDLSKKSTSIIILFKEISKNPEEKKFLSKLVEAITQFIEYNDLLFKYEVIYNLAMKALNEMVFEMSSRLNTIKKNIENYKN